MEKTMANFDPNSVTGLIGLWDFKSGAETADTGLDDGIAQNGNNIDGNGQAPGYAGDRLIVGAGSNSHPTVFDVNADPDSAADDEQFNLDRGTLEVQFEQFSQSGWSDDVILSRGEKHIDAHDEGFFEIRVTKHGAVEAYHNTDKGDAVTTLSTSAGFFSPGDVVNVKYSFDVDTGATLTVENKETGQTETIESGVTGLTFDLTDNDDEEFTFGAREQDDGHYDKEFQGAIDYVALYESASAPPDGAVDGEDFGEEMILGYDDSNAPTDQGGDIITEDADLIFGNGGDDTINGEDGNDTIYGDDGASGSFTGPRESFNWDHVTGHQADSTVTQNTGSVNVTYTRTEDTGHHESDIDNHTHLNTAGIDSGSESIDTDSALTSETRGNGNTGEFQWDFSDPVGNLEFNINDLDGDGVVTVTAFDAGNNPIEVTLQGGSDIAIDGNVAEANGPYQNVNDPDTTVQVSIAGPVSRVVLEHTQEGHDNSGIHVTDMYFDTGFDPDQDGQGGDDVITGAEGADEIYGEGGDDTFIVSSTTDADGDTITGGNGPDDTLDNDTLDLRGTGQLTITDAADASDDGARSGTVTFADGAVLEFSQIETILTDPQRDGVVDGEDFGEVMGPGYNDSNAPNDGGGDIIDGADGDDDVIEGNGGDDTIDAGEGADTVDGGTGNDEITGADGDDSVDGGEGADTLMGGDGTDTLNGGQGDDDIAVGGDDEASGGTGDDEFTVDGTDPAADIDATIDGGSDGTDGNPDGPENGDDGDILNLGDRTEDLTVILEDADPENGTVNGLDADDTPDITFEEIERIVTGSGDDTIDAKDADGPIDVETGAGDDSVDGGDGDDKIDTGPGDDTVYSGDGSDTVDGGNGDNYIDTSLNSGLPLPDDGFPSYGPFPAVPADADPNDDRDLVTTGNGNDTIYTGDDDDTINAGAGDNYVDAGIDDDEITTLFGDDTIVGGEGDDTISSGAGDDLIYGGLDPNVVPFDQVNIPNAPDGGTFGPDPDESNGKDLIDAGAGNDTVYGQDDDDTIYGGGGSDLLYGGVDNDLIYGGNGRDTIYGGQGADSLFGDAGSDEFRYDAREEAFGDEVDGGTEDGDNDPTTDNENDQLYLQGMGRFEIVESDGVSPLDLTTPNDPDGNSFSGQVNFLDANGDVEGTLTFTEIEDIIPCFTPGTVIATPQGERLVEELREGDKIITRDNGLQEIRWVGRRDLSGQELVRAPHLKPVLIRAGSLGRGLPERDMMVSPQHRLLINNERSALYFEDREVLAAAKHLTGMDGVASVEASSVSYIHFMFDQHEVVLSNGAWTESFQPGDTVLDAMGDAQRNEIFDLFPELSETEGLDAYTAARRSLKKHEARLLVK
jgi:Ca2+-binding RTX toxin-like protein